MQSGGPTDWHALLTLEICHQHGCFNKSELLLPFSHILPYSTIILQNVHPHSIWTQIVTHIINILTAARFGVQILCKSQLRSMHHCIVQKKTKKTIWYRNTQKLMHCLRELVKTFPDRCDLALIMVQDIGKKAFKIHCERSSFHVTFLWDEFCLCASALSPLIRNIM